MRLNKLKFCDKKTFDRYLRRESHELSVYSFANIYIWRKFFDIYWAVINDSLCVFFKDNIGSFLYLNPLAKKNNFETILEVFKILDKLNKNQELSHIENVEEKNLPFYKDLGFNCVLKSCDYLCRRSDLADLRGDNFKSKRASCNYFIKHYDFKFEDLKAAQAQDCINLYNLWMKQREVSNPDHIYQGMLSDSLVTLKGVFANYSGLKLRGGAVRVSGNLRGFTLGYELSPGTFCILFEITDLSIKGLAQFIFREFSRRLKEYKYINVMDDSGLENLRKVKLSYRPEKLLPAYIVRRAS